MITIEQKNPTFDEIQEAVIKEGIQLSKAKFREYVTIGLVKGNRQHGGTRGSRSSTYPKGIEIILLIHQLNKRPHRIELQDIMYLLYWRGLPIDDDKLFIQLLTYQEQLIKDMNRVAEKRRTDPETHEYEIKTKLEQELRQYHFFKPGPPTNSVITAYKSDVERHMSEIDTLYSFIQSLIEYGRIPYEEVLSYYSQDMNYPYEIIQTTSSFIEEYINYESLTDQKPFTDPQHIKQSRELVYLFQEYLIDLFQLLDNHLPADNELSRILHNLFSDSAFSNHPVITKQLLFALVANGHTSGLLHFLKKYKGQWKIIIEIALNQSDFKLFEK